MSIYLTVRNVSQKCHLLYCRLEVCLQQNSILNMFEDDYKLLSDMDGITGRKSDTTLKEYQSFTDLQFSKNRVITHIEWHPTVKGIPLQLCLQLCDMVIGLWPYELTHGVVVVDKHNQTYPATL